MKLLYKYTNGNTNVSIYDNGTKIREYDGIAKPIHPESMDVKITNFCDGGCRWCHEKSNMLGKHADLDRLLEVIKNLPAGVEIALGGGNPLTHPELLPFLKELKARGLIANMTVNQKHFKQYHDSIKILLAEDLIKGLGVSYSDSKYLKDIEPFIAISSNIVFHVIMGVNDVKVIDELFEFTKVQSANCKVLVLGYKDYGNGSHYYGINKKAIDENKLRWYCYIATYFKKSGITLSFDNLAIDQLNLKRFFTEKAWDKFYMGDEGRFSSYIDAVNQHYAICSVDPNRVSFDDMDLFTFFGGITDKRW